MQRVFDRRERALHVRGRIDAAETRGLELELRAAKGEPVDLAAFWKGLGVAQIDGRIVLDDAAPLAKWRKMIVFGPPGRPPRHVKLPWQS